MSSVVTPAVGTGRTGSKPVWRPLHRVAATAALATAIIIPVQVAVFLIWPPPLDGTSADWFDLISRRRFAGLVDLDILLVVDNVLLIPLLVAFGVLLWRTSPTWVVLAGVTGVTAAIMAVVVNPAIGMVVLNDQYADATTDAARAAALSAGDALLATWQGTAFHTGYLLGSLAGAALGVVMLHGGPFGKLTGWMGILGNGVGLGLYLPGIGVYVAVFSVLFLEIWYILVARTLVLVDARPVSGGPVSSRPG